MLNKYPLWKYILLMLALLAGVLYSMPNLYAPDPALQITGESSSLVLDQRALNRGLLALVCVNNNQVFVFLQMHTICDRFV